MNLHDDWQLTIRPTRIPGDGQLHLLDVPPGALQRAYYVQGPPGAYRRIEIEANTVAGIVAGLEEALITQSTFGVFPPEVLKSIQVNWPLPSGSTWTGTIPELYRLIAGEIKSVSKPIFEQAKLFPDAVDHSRAAQIMNGRESREAEIAELQSFADECTEAIAELQSQPELA